jgi:CBS domain-containing protein
MTLREVLHAHIPTLTKESTVRDAVDKMDVYQFPALVLVGSDSEPLAVITEGDICRAATQNDGVISIGKENAFTYATKEPTTAHADTEISDALHLMLSTGITVLPVVDESRFIGMVLRIDLIQAMLMDLSS